MKREKIIEAISGQRLLLWLHTTVRKLASMPSTVAATVGQPLPEWGKSILIRQLTLVKFAVTAARSIKTAVQRLPLFDHPMYIPLTDHLGRAGFIERVARGSCIHPHHARMAVVCTARAMEVPREGR